jgi:integrase
VGCGRRDELVNGERRFRGGERVHARSPRTASSRGPEADAIGGEARACAAADAGIGIHQLRHAHATELINSGVSIEVVRRRLGHASTETTQVYTLLADKVADTEIRVARRKRETGR